MKVFRTDVVGISLIWQFENITIIVMLKSLYVLGNSQILIVISPKYILLA